MSKYSVGWGEVGFWDRIADGDLRQRRDINDALATTDALQDDVMRTTSRLEAVEKKLFYMEVLNGVLLKMLSEGGQVDLTTLRYRVEAQADEIQAARTAGSQSGGRTMPATITCPRCQQAVPPNQTTMTEQGVICDRCAAG